MNGTVSEGYFSIQTITYTSFVKPDFFNPDNNYVMYNTTSNNFI